LIFEIIHRYEQKLTSSMHRREIRNSGTEALRFMQKENCDGV